MEEMNIKTDTVASLRLDAVLCAAFGISRSKAAEIIAAGRVSLDNTPCQQASKELKEGALISAPGLGSAKLLEIGGLSKKGRMFIKIEMRNKS
jgi:RNA-binding protein YlmH